MEETVLLWSVGGFAVGCVFGALVVRRLPFGKKALTSQTINNAELLRPLSFSSENIYSNMTLMLGSPTASGLIESQEYPIYAATANYPNLDGNRLVMSQFKMIWVERIQPHPQIFLIDMSLQQNHKTILYFEWFSIKCFVENEQSVHFLTVALRLERSHLVEPSLMARYLTEDVYEELYQRKTTSGTNLDSCIQTGIDNPEKVSCGIVAGDEECYDVFADIFDPVITDRHRGFRRGVRQQETKLIVDGLKAEPFDSKYVKSTHFLVGRCLRGFRFPPSCCRAERQHAENLLAITLKSFKNEFAGTYIELPGLSRDQFQQLPDILQNIAIRPTSSTLQACGSTRDWPHGRGVFYNHDVTLFAWTNREDHLRIMYRDRQLDFIESFRLFCKAMHELGENLTDNGLEFAFHNDYGYLLTCPSGIGTALRAGVHMKLPQLLRDQRFRTILKNLRLHMGAEDQEMYKKGYVDVYNMDRLGKNEAELVQHVADSVHTLIEMEKRLEKKISISELITAQDMD
ncbi:creatine kinase M-type-like [Hydractinia symbiolongicarpus]|uniref:creatine kinase M-type-like n=1 Tax=Hydractinia symbiolongicarpus TaxID=13093 RepID=UPI0025508E8E|nr:creatine kinase M-type-like [Hydractinia symbiolongicarpus]